MTGWIDRLRRDNAQAESFFTAIKLEGLRPSYPTRDAAVASIGQFIARHNARRLHSMLGYRSPIWYGAGHRRSAG